MKKAPVLLFLLFFASVSFAGDGDDAVVRWENIVGVITAPAVNNPVAGIASGLLPWAATRGKARVNLANGDMASRLRAWYWSGQTLLERVETSPM